MLTAHKTSRFPLVASRSLKAVAIFANDDNDMEFFPVLPFFGFIDEQANIAIKYPELNRDKTTT